MARARSEKSKSKPLDKSVDKKKKMKTGQSDEAKAESIELARSEDSAQHHSLEPPTEPTERLERQRTQHTQEPPADLEELNILPEDTLSTASPDNGHLGIEDDSATHRRVAERAFMLFQENGCEHGNDWAHWFEAERQIRV
jgi:hypothetical protein